MLIEHATLRGGLRIPRVITGLWQIADMERDGRAIDSTSASLAMDAYVDAGLTAFDMADHYGSAELIAGVHRGRAGAAASQLFTKWVPTPGPLTRADVRKAVETALTRMQSDRIDLMQFHAWMYADPAWLDALFFLQELKSEGLIAALGVTNFDTAHLRIATASGIEIATNQICYSLLDQRARGRMTAYCLQHGIGILAFGTVAGGLLSDRWLNKDAPDPTERTWSQMKYLRFVEQIGGWERLQALLRVLHGVASKYQVSVANVACRYMMEQPGVAGIIIGARLGQRAHIDDTLRLFSFSLDQESSAAIAAALEGLTPIHRDCGDEYRKPPFLTASGDLSHHIDNLPSPYEARHGQDGRRRVFSGTSWEDSAGYCRAVRVGDRVVVSGTTATHGTRVIGGIDAEAQAHFVFDKIEGALLSAGSQLEDVVRTRIFVSDVQHWEQVARAHGERFGAIRPANTLVQANLIGDEYLVEIEAEAVVTPDSPRAV